MVRRLTPLALGALIATATLAGATAASAAWPASGHGAVSDGDRVALLSPDRSTVEIYRNAQRSGRAVAVPDATRSTMRPVGVFGARVFLAGYASDASNLKFPGPDDRMAIADTASGQWHWLCGPPETLGPDGPVCLRGTSSQGSIPHGDLPTVISAGRRWINVWWTTDFQVRALIKWSEKDGRFQARWSTERERDKVYAAVGKRNWIEGTPMTLSAKRVGPVKSGGYARTVNAASLFRPYRDRVRVRLRRGGDRRSAALLVYDTGGSSVQATSGVGFTSRGACVASIKQVAVWDKRTRRVWTHPIDPALGVPSGTPGKVLAGPAVLCAGSSVLVIGRAGGGAPGYVPSITTLRWPNDRSHAGWRKGARLRPGKTRTIR